MRGCGQAPLLPYRYILAERGRLPLQGSAAHPPASICAGGGQRNRDLAADLQRGAAVGGRARRRGRLPTAAAAGAFRV